MQAVILAAGLGRRLGALTEFDTKCMLEVNGVRLIDRALDCLASHGVARTVLVVGHAASRVIEHVGHSWGGMAIEYVENPVYELTNNIYSLSLASELLVADDTILLESDVIFDCAVISELLAAPQPNVAVVARYQPWMNGTVVQLSPGGRIRRFVPGRDLVVGDSHTYFKTVNIYKLSRGYLQSDFVPFLLQYCTAQRRNEYYEEVLRLLTQLGTCPIQALALPAEVRWFEIDDPEDLANAETLFADSGRAVAAYSQRHGGYWRFPGLVDYCYLANPYFPPQRLVRELGAAAPMLLSGYPSCGRVQSELAASVFGVPAEQVIVGAGAAELISVIGRNFRDSHTFCRVPTFEEWPARFNPDRVTRASVGSSVTDLLAASLGHSVVVLVNPDNPTGGYIPRADVLDLAAELRVRGVTLVVDESFVDFAWEGRAGSLLDPQVLVGNVNLVVVRSISKSHGVPGLRLGVLASGDRELVDSLRAMLPVWNVNAFAEFFLQVVGRYQDLYWEACARVRRDRELFAAELAGLPGVTVHPSQANFLMIALDREAGAATQLAELLLARGYLVKDLSAKAGLGGANLLRLGVRSAPENQRLVAVLAGLLRPARVAALAAPRGAG